MVRILKGCNNKFKTNDLTTNSKTIIALPFTFYPVLLLDITIIMSGESHEDDIKCLSCEALLNTAWTVSRETQMCKVCLEITFDSIANESAKTGHARKVIFVLPYIADVYFHYRL